jgi:hypothetical protein
VAVVVVVAKFHLLLQVEQVLQAKGLPVVLVILLEATLVLAAAAQVLLAAIHRQ